MRAARDCLDAGSPVARALPGFRPRSQQLEMAAAVEEALADGRHLVVEAGTGVGKSFAYLVPVLLHLAEGGGPVVVATRTIALQEQLVERDVPLLLGALGLDSLPVALAKGRGNYVCRRRLDMAASEGRGLLEQPQQLAQLQELVAWAERSEDGSLSDLPFRPLPDVWEVARAEAGNCLHKRCRFYRDCAYQRSRRRLYGARLVVANHALVFADLALREAGAKLLPDYDGLVLDEAHEIENGAAENFGARITRTGLLRQLGRFMGRRTRTGLFGRVEVGKELYDLLEETRAGARQLFEGVHRLRGERGEVRLRAAAEYADPLSTPLRKLVRALREEQPADPEVNLEWKARTDRLDETLATLALVHGQLDTELVYWIEPAGRGDSALRAAPVEVAPLLRRTLFSRTRCVVLTSATLQVAGTFDHFKRRVGLDEPDELGLGSPFDFKRQCRLLLHPRVPDPTAPSYDDAVVARVRDLVKTSEGGAFVLFTSYRALERAHTALRGELEAAGLTVLRQGDRRHRDIVQAFAERDDCVLFATDTFWQGIDVRGDNLRLVVLTRLPFAVPDHPLQQARVEKIEEAGGHAFRDFALPQAVLKLRQGFGRLIRTHEDTGTVAILDPRIRTKSYGKTFLRSLPDCTIEDRP